MFDFAVFFLLERIFADQVPYTKPAKIKPLKIKVLTVGQNVFTRQEIK